MVVHQVQTKSETESWNGTSWTEVSDLNTGRYNGQGAGESNTAAIIGGGYTGTANTTNAELWNGSAWSEQNNINTARNGLQELEHPLHLLLLGDNLMHQMVQQKHGQQMLLLEHGLLLVL